MKLIAAAIAFLALCAPAQAFPHADTHPGWDPGHHRVSDDSSWDPSDFDWTPAPSPRHALREYERMQDDYDREQETDQEERLRISDEITEEIKDDHRDRERERRQRERDKKCEGLRVLYFSRHPVSTPASLRTTFGCDRWEADADYHAFSPTGFVAGGLVSTLTPSLDF